MRIGLLTGGGDCPGLNAVIRAVVRTGLRSPHNSFLGFHNGWSGVLAGDAHELTFTSTAIEPVAGGTRLRVPGSLGTGDTTLEHVPATLLLRVVERTDADLLVVGTARVPYGPLHRTTGFALSRTRPARHLGLLVAAEFTCAP